MPSVFTWVDYSKAQQDALTDAIDAFREHGTRDEVGLSVIRDGFADLFFPGTGSLQRRARYFLFIPWMYLQLEGDRVRSSDIVGRAKKIEVGLIDALLAAQEDAGGVIGERSRDKLKRLPSNIYWNGLRRLGIRTSPFSQDQYHRSLDRFYRAQSPSPKNVDKERVEETPPNWHAGVPPVPAGFPERASFRLTLREAEYVRERIRANASSSLMRYYLDHMNAASDAPFAWAHELAPHLPEPLAQPLVHARNFSEVMAGALILYNLRLCQLRNMGNRETEVRRLFEEWCDEIERREHELRAWDRQAFWMTLAQADVKPGKNTQTFVNAWIDLALDDPGPRRVVDLQAAHDLIRRREVQLKGALARLDNQQPRDRWTGSSGLGRLDYRWSNAQILLNDVVNSLEGAHA
ncbi:MAG: DUF6361 family protein [Candidatus Rokubacteria bacterium]|nr:DUF6361 family protein [Candidatus Rokubacteria bacterium]